MSRVHEVLEFLGIDDAQLLDALRQEGLFEAEELDASQAEELRVAAVMMRELGVNAAGVQVILQMRRRLLVLQDLSEQALERILREGR